MSTEIYLVRHGQTYGNIESRWCGHTDTPLTPLGVAQARAAGRRLAAIELTAAVSSDLSRAADTARHAIEGRDIPHALDPGLREMFYGEWEDRHGAEAQEQHPELLREFYYCRQTLPGAEQFHEIRSRTKEAFWRAVEANRGGNILMVSHGNAMMALMAELLNLPIEATWSFTFENASLSRLHVSRSGRLTIHALNDSSHIAGLTHEEED
ncbi:MAG: histidine phosphatase family protein [Dehalococcoidia bacterium]